MNLQVRAAIEERIKHTLETCRRWGANTAVELRHDKELIDYYNTVIKERKKDYDFMDEQRRAFTKQRIAELTGKIGGLQKQINRLEKENDKLRKAAK